MKIQFQWMIVVTLIALSACNGSDDAKSPQANDIMVVDDNLMNIDATEVNMPMPEPVTTAGRSERLRSCSLNDNEVRSLFDEFVRLEDQLGFSQRGQIEARVAASNDVTVACVKQTMISALEAGMIRPEPR